MPGSISERPQRLGGLDFLLITLNASSLLFVDDEVSYFGHRCLQVHWPGSEVYCMGLVWAPFRMDVAW